MFGPTSVEPTAFIKAALSSTFRLGIKRSLWWEEDRAGPNKLVKYERFSWQLITAGWIISIAFSSHCEVCIYKQMIWINLENLYITETLRKVSDVAFFKKKKKNTQKTWDGFLWVFSKGNLKWLALTFFFFFFWQYVHLGNLFSHQKDITILFIKLFCLFIWKFLRKKNLCTATDVINIICGYTVFFIYFEKMFIPVEFMYFDEICGCILLEN